jgi:hypothetical protein
MMRRFLLGIVLYFFGPQGLTLQKISLWSLLYDLLRVSKHENTIEFTFFGLIKPNIEGPIWD